MSSRPSGIRPPSRIQAPSSGGNFSGGGRNNAGGGGSGAESMSGLARPPGSLGNPPGSSSSSTMMKYSQSSSTANSSPVPSESPLNFREADMPQSGPESVKDMESWNSNGYSSNDSGNGSRAYDSRRESEVLTEDTDSFIIGDVVWVGGAKRGKIAFIGETHFAKGEWAGIVLDAPFGKNDGTVSGVRYFQCEPNHGTFTRLTRLTRQPLPPYDSEECFIHGTTPPRCLSDYRRSPSPFRSKSPSPGPMTPTRLGSPGPSIKIGERVIVQSSSGTKRGILRYLGTTMFATGEWAGIELDMAMGKNDGSVGGHRYFSCPDKYGLFAPVSKVSSSPANRLSTPTLRKHGSRESMLSNLSSVPSSSAPRALRSVLQEKEKHLEQLLKERDLDMSEVAQANREYEDRIEELQDIRASLLQSLEEVQRTVTEYAGRTEELEEENRSMKLTLEEERREHEDLLFKYEEDRINQADLAARLCSEDGKEGDADDLIALRLILHQSSDKLKEREAELSIANEKLGKALKRVDELGAEKQEHLSLINKNNAQLEECHKQIRKLEESLAAEILHSQHAIGALERAHAHKIAEVSNFGEQVENLSSKVVHLLQEVELMRAERIHVEDELTKKLIEKMPDAQLLEERFKGKEGESEKLLERISELQGLNSSLITIWEGKLRMVEDGFKVKEDAFQNTIRELREEVERGRQGHLNVKKIMENSCQPSQVLESNS